MGSGSRGCFFPASLERFSLFRFSVLSRAAFSSSLLQIRDRADLCCTG